MRDTPRTAVIVVLMPGEGGGLSAGRRSGTAFGRSGMFGLWILRHLL